MSISSNRSRQDVGRRYGSLVLAMAALVWLGAASGTAARADEGIVVQGAGQAKARPTQVEIQASISGEAEIASDATVKFRDARKRALAAIEALKNPDLKVESAGISVNQPMDANQQQMMMQGRSGGGAVKQKVQVAENSKIVLANVDKLTPEALLEMVLKIVDTAKDAGFQIGPGAASNYYEIQARMGAANSIVSFKIPDTAALRDQAYQAAIEDAKAKARKLADLAGVKLGRVISIQEAPAAKADSAMPNYIYYMMGLMGGKGGSDDKSLVGSTFGELTMNVNLTVQFEILK